MTAPSSSLISCCALATLNDRNWSACLVDDISINRPSNSENRCFSRCNRSRSYCVTEDFSFASHQTDISFSKQSLQNYSWIIGTLITLRNQLLLNQYTYLFKNKKLNKALYVLVTHYCKNYLKILFFEKSRFVWTTSWKIFREWLCEQRFPNFWRGV